MGGGGRGEGASRATAFASLCLSLGLSVGTARPNVRTCNCSGTGRPQPSCQANSSSVSVVGGTASKKTRLQSAVNRAEHMTGAQRQHGQQSRDLPLRVPYEPRAARVQHAAWLSTPLGSPAVSEPHSSAQPVAALPRRRAPTVSCTQPKQKRTWRFSVFSVYTYTLWMGPSRTSNRAAADRWPKQVPSADRAACGALTKLAPS